MAAIAVKSHSTDTSAQAETASRRTGFPVVGGVALNYPVGGLNPYAVQESARHRTAGSCGSPRSVRVTSRLIAVANPTMPPPIKQ
jgi:hypothetical protein